MRALRLVSLAALISTTACTDPLLSPLEQIESVETTENWTMPELQAPVHVVRTESNVPHIYAENRWDMGFVYGFTTARDRFFFMDLARRLGRGRLSSLLGDVVLESDLESRGVGLTHVAQQIHDGLTPKMAAQFDAFAAGVNAYIEAVKRDDLPPPSELQIAKGLLGSSIATDLMEPFDRQDLAAIMAVVIYQSSYETGDVGRAANKARLPTSFEGAPFQALRRNGAILDLDQRIAPIFNIASAPGFGTHVGGAQALTEKVVAPPWKTKTGPGRKAAQVPTSVLERMAKRYERLQVRLNRDRKQGFGSNAWAVMGSASTNGAGIAAGDGHLSLTVPSTLYQIGLDTSALAGGEIHQLGMVISGMPLMPIGTNGQVAWSQTQLSGDITDWYAETITLDSSGRPQESLFNDTWRELVPRDEVFEIRAVPALGSEERVETWRRWETFDGRWIADVEGRSASPDEELAPGESLLNFQGDWVVPGDENGDGVITAVSFDYTGFDAGSIVETVDALGLAEDVYDFREASRGLVAYSQNFAVADGDGNVLYTAYQAVPCRKYLPRDFTGPWAEGADPALLLDGNTYGSFRIPIGDDGLVNEAPGADDEYSCVVPFDVIPQSINPDTGFVANANNDPAYISTDNSLVNDDWYIGGPWDAGWRMDTINRELSRLVAEGNASPAEMSVLQGNHQSRVGELFLPRMLEALVRAKSLSGQSGLTDSEQRMVAIYDADSARIDEVHDRLQEWADAGYQAESGVETFYHSPTEANKRDAIATMLFNAWMGHFRSDVFNDEPLPGVFHGGGLDGRLRALDRMLTSRGEDNSLNLASWNPDTQESIFFDVLSTEEVETSDELMLMTLRDALAFLESEPTDPDEGGFGTSDMEQWLWGMRHYVRFESLLADFIGDDPQFAALTGSFSVHTGVLPLMPDLPANDPRRALEWFPRPGDQDAVDAANNGLNKDRFSYGSGPVMRMVVSLRGDEVTGVNILPGGQSSIIESPYFADQAKLWLGNRTHPIRFHVPSVVAGAIGREVFSP